MKISIISFTRGGRRLSVRLRELLAPTASVQLYCKSQTMSGKTGTVSDIGGADAGMAMCNGPLSEWAAQQFQEQTAMVFIGACGIAVRAIAGCLRDKLTDVPVLVLDERGAYVIPILSGHYGGANQLAKELADLLGAVAVLTTATDVNGHFAVDVFAREQGLSICNRDGIKAVSCEVLAGKPVTIAVDGSYTGPVPEELTLIAPDGGQDCDIFISPYRKLTQTALLQLCPRIFWLGMGCQKGKTLDALAHVVQTTLKQLNIPMAAVAGIASIDLKQNEPGLCALAEKYRLPFRVFSSSELAQVPGTFNSSAFVAATTGVDNVCERAAVAACQGNGCLKLRKQAGDGITLAIAAEEWRISF